MDGASGLACCKRAPASSLLHRNRAEGLLVGQGGLLGLRRKSGRGGGYCSVAARQRAEGGQPAGRRSSLRATNTHTLVWDTLIFTRLEILPGSTTEYCQTQKHDQFKTNRQSTTVCSIDPHFAFNTQDEHTEAPLTKVFLHMNSEGLVQQPEFCRPLHVDKNNNVTHWKNKVKWSFQKNKQKYTGKNSRNMTITSSS